MKKLTLILITFLFVLSSTLTFAYATNTKSEGYQKLKHYYSLNKILTTPEEIMAVEALGFEVEDGFTYSDLKNQDFQKMKFSDLSKTIIAMTVSGIDPRDINGVNVVDILESYIQEDGSLNNNGYIIDGYTLPWVVWALYIVDSDQLEKVGSYLASQQVSDGGFGGYGYTDVDTTGQVIQALCLVDSKKYEKVIQKSIQYMKSFQQADSGFRPYSFGSVNPDTQASAILGLLAYDMKGIKGAQYDIGNKNPYDYLIDYQADNGSFSKSGFNLKTTATAALTIGTYENGDFFKGARKEYKALLDKNNQENMKKRKQSYQTLRNYYSQIKQIDRGYDYLAIKSLDLDINQYNKPDLESLEYNELYESELSQVILNLLVEGKNPHNIKGKDLINILESYIQEDGTIAKKDPITATSQVWCLYALYATDSEKKNIVADKLASMQNHEGAFGYPGYEDLDTTGWVVDALSLVDKLKYQKVLEKSISYFLSQQQSDGTFGIAKSVYDVFPNSNTQSSVILGLTSYDQDGLESGKYHKDVFDVLLSFQNSDGTFGWSNQDYNQLSTQQATWTLGNYYNGNVMKKLKYIYHQLQNTEQQPSIKDENNDVHQNSQIDKNFQSDVDTNKQTQKKTEEKNRLNIYSNIKKSTISHSQIVSPNITDDNLNDDAITKTYTVEKKEVVGNENPVIKYTLIIAGGIVLLAMLKITVSLVKKKG